MNLSRVFFCLELFIFVVTIASSQWTQTDGPYGGSVLCFAKSGSNVYAGTQGGGIFLSTNDGTSWTFIGAPFRPDSVRAIAAIDTNIFAVSSARGVYRSTDSGATWIEINNGLISRSIFSLATDGSQLFAGTDNGVFLTQDYGESWSARNNGLPTYGGGKIYSARALFCTRIISVLWLKWRGSLSFKR